MDGAAKELKIRLSNVNIKVSNREYEAAMDISGGGKTKIELDGQNRLDNSQAQANAGLRKQGEGTLIITDETDDNGNKITAPKSGTSGSLTAKGATSNGSAGIGGKIGESTKTSPSRAMQPLTQQAAVRVQVSAAAAEPPVMFPEMQKTSSSGGIPR